MKEDLSQDILVPFYSRIVSAQELLSEFQNKAKSLNLSDKEIRDLIDYLCRKMLYGLSGDISIALDMIRRGHNYPVKSQSRYSFDEKTTKARILNADDPADSAFCEFNAMRVGYYSGGLWRERDAFKTLFRIFK